MKSINTLACTIATYLDVLMGDMAKRPDRITLEIKQERREQARWWKKLRTEGQETIL